MTDKISLSAITSFQNDSTAVAAYTANNSSLTSAVNNTLSRDGTSPNQMNYLLDMNSNQIINLPIAATPNSPLRLQDLSTFVGGGTVTNIPAGGTTNQVLGKASNLNYVVAWINSVSSVGLSMPADFVVANSPVTTTGTITASYALIPTGTGGFVRSTSPTLITPILGVATGTSLNLSGLTASSAVATDGSKNLVSVTNTGTGNNVLATSPTITTPVIASITNIGTLTLPTSTDTLIGKATTDILTNKTFDTAGAGNVFKINGVTITANTGTGSNVLATSPTLVTPALGTPTAGVLTSCTGLPLTTGITGILGVANGGVGVSLSATGGASQVLKQTSVGGTITVAQLAASDLSNGNTGSGLVALQTSPTLITPVLGVASATSITLANGSSNGVQLTAASGTNGALSMGVGGSILFVLGSAIGSFSVNDHLGNTVLTIVETTPGTLSTAQLVFSGTNQSTSIGSGSVQILGGLGIAKDIVSGGSIYTSTATFMNRSKTTFTNNAAAATATLTNSPTAGNPTKWIGIDDNGTTRFVPAW